MAPGMTWPGTSSFPSSLRSLLAASTTLLFIAKYPPGPKAVLEVCGIHYCLIRSSSGPHETNHSHPREHQKSVTQ